MTVADRRQIPAGMSAFGPERAVPAVVECGLLAREALVEGATGRVAAVFENSFYIVFDGNWVCIGPRHLGSGPLQALCASRPADWPAIGDVATVGDAVLRIGRRPFATLAGAALWTPEPPPRWTLATLRDGLEAVDALWRSGEDGLAAAVHLGRHAGRSPLLDAAAPGLAALERIVVGAVPDRRDGSVMDEAGRAGLVGLIGLGPGLTPSGDDVLAGALIALAALDRLVSRDRLWGLCRVHLDCTNEISGAHLRAAARGYGAAALHGGIAATMAGDARRLAAALAELATLGHSSGRDGFAGALIALRAASGGAAGG